MTTVYLEHPFNPGATTAYTFNTDFDISFPATGTTGANFSRDSFAFTFGSGFENASPTRLFSLNFAPNATDTNQMRISFTDYGTSIVTNPIISGSQATIRYNGVYHLSLSVNANTNSAMVTITGTNSFSFTAALAAGEVANVREFAATWILANGTANSGSNALIMDNVSIPEPSTWAMFGAGVLGLAVFARRRVRA